MKYDTIIIECFIGETFSVSIVFWADFHSFILQGFHADSVWCHDQEQGQTK